MKSIFPLKLNSRSSFLVAALAVTFLVGGGFVYFASVAHAPAETATTTPAITAPAVDMPEAAPVRLRIPTVKIDAPFEGGLGLNADQSIAVPESFTEVGWYKFGPTPGELGPAVILGHVDSYRGPAVFWSLGQLKAGDEIFVDREDGTTARFVVTELVRANQNDFPTRAVYGDIDHAGLRLITCSGVYDKGKQRYSHNLIVFAKLDEGGE